MPNKRTVFVLLLIVSLSNTEVFAQTLKGCVKDATSGAVICDASIFCFTKSSGAISNKNGCFVLNGLSNNDSITISCLNYGAVTKSVHEIWEKNDTIVSLIPLTNTLPDIVISSISASDLLTRALQKTEQSLNRDIVLDTYYREYLKLNDSIKKFSDGLVDFWIRPKTEDVMVSIKDSRSVVNFSENERSIAKNYYNAMPIQKIIENYFPQKISKTLNPIDPKLYKYTLLRVDSNSIAVHISPQQNNKEYNNQVDVYIDKKDTLLSTVRIFLPSDKKETTIKKNLFARASIEAVNILIQFRKENNKIILSHVRSGIHYKNISKLFKIDWVIEAVSELVLLRTSSEGSVKDFADKNKYDKKFLYEQGNQSKSAFWKTEDIIVGTPEEINFINKASVSKNE